MINDKKVLCVIPARGGSKGIPLKNIKKINGKSLIELAAICAREIKEIDKIILSTDNETIANEGLLKGIETPFVRPPEISGDRVSDIQVLEHALEMMEEIDNTRYDLILMLQPTSPLRNSKDVKACIHKIKKEKLDAVWTVSKSDSKNHPLKQLILDNFDKLSYYDNQGSQIIARQELSSLYHRNGVAYIFTRDCIVNQKTIMGRKTGGFLVNSFQISIDSFNDLELAEFYINKRKNNDKK